MQDKGIKEALRYTNKVYNHEKYNAKLNRIAGIYEEIY